MNGDRPKPPPPPAPDEFAEELPHDLSSIAEAIASTAGRKAIEMTADLLREAVVEALRSILVDKGDVYGQGLVRITEVQENGRVVLSVPDASLREQVQKTVARVYGVDDLVVDE